MTKLLSKGESLSAKNILSNFLSKEMALSYTAVKAMRNKKVFSTDYPKFYECFKGMKS